MGRAGSEVAFVAAVFTVFVVVFFLAGFFAPVPAGAGLAAGALAAPGFFASVRRVPPLFSRGEGTTTLPVGAVMPSACRMLSRMAWSCCRVVNCSCSAAISAAMRSCSLRLCSRSLVTWLTY